MRLEDIQIGETDRGFAVGMTGSGKTTLCEYLLANMPSVLAIDPKGMLKWSGFERVTRLKQLVARANANRKARLIYAPIASELRDPMFHEAFFRFVYERRHTFCYVDEVYAVAYRDELPASYHAILTRGRERGNGLLSATQRPMKIPAVIMSECEFWYVFRLSMPADRKKVEETIGLDSDTIVKLPKRTFFFSRADENLTVGPLTLNIKDETNGKGHASVPL